MNKKIYYSTFFCCLSAMYSIGQQEESSELKPSQINNSETGSTVSEVNPIPIELKYSPEEFYVINDKAVSKKEYLEHISKQNEFNQK